MVSRQDKHRERILENSRRFWRPRVISMIAKANGIAVDGRIEAKHQRLYSQLTGLAEVTIEGVLRDKHTRPDLETISRFAEHTGYSVIDQVRDLFRLDESDLNLWSSRWSPAVGYEDLRLRLLSALEQSQADVPTTADLAARVLRSCVESDVPGRWRARLYDVAGGWDFPHVAYNVVYFTRWYGPFNGSIEVAPDDVEVAEKVGRHAATDQLPYSFLKRHPEPQFLRFGAPGEPMRQKHDEPVSKPVKQEWWARVVRDRRELTARLQPMLSSMNGYWGQFSGIHSLALTGGPPLTPVDQLLAPTMRHTWIEPATRLRPGGHIPREVARGRTPTTLILVTGEQAMHLRRIADLMGEALGWRSVSNRDLVYRRTGHRIRLQDRDQHDLNMSMLRELAANPPQNMVVAMNLGYMLEERPYRVPAEVEDVLRLPHLQAISLAPIDPETLLQWQVREHGRGAFMIPDGEGTPESMQEALARLEAFCPLLDEINRDDEAHARARGYQDAFPKRLLLGRVGPVYPWGTPGVRPGLWGPAKWYEHPLIGDITVRVAYECATRFLDGRPLSRHPQERRPHDFVPGSVLARHETRLMAIPFPDDQMWRPEGVGERFFDKYLAPPVEDPPPGRAVRFAPSWAEARPVEYRPADLSAVDALATPELSKNTERQLPAFAQRIRRNLHREL